MRRRHLPMFLTLAWMTTVGPWHHAPAAQGNDHEQTKEMGAREPDVGYVPTPQHVVNLMLGLANVEKTDLLYDLGCGDGRIVVTASQKYGCKALGVDIDSARVRESLANVKEANLENLVTIEQKDVFELDLSEADVVTLYLSPEMIFRLIPQLEMMKPGSRIVSHDFAIRGVKPDVVVTIPSRLHEEHRFQEEHKIYLWTLPLNKVASTALKSDGRGHRGQRPGPLIAGLTYVSHSVPLLLAIAALGLAAVFWLLRKRLGVIKINVTIDRPQRPDDRDTP